MNKKYLSATFLWALWLFSCVEPYDLKFNSTNKILTIEATITDADEEQTVLINEFINNGNSGYNSPIRKAVVELVIDGKEKVALTEKPSGGVYALPASFKLKYGTKYKLVFTKADGTKYESTEDAVTKVPPIEKVYAEFNSKGIASGDVKLPAHELYVDFQDPAEVQNNYVWTYKFWERQNICMTCEGGRYFTTPAPLGTCRAETRFAESTFDYECSGKCWDIFYNTDLNVLSDTYANGKKVIGKLAAKIPYYQQYDCLVELKQQSVSAQAYRYLRLMVEQTQNTGSLADTPPAALIGNIKNLSNPQESIAGFFMVMSVAKTNYWLSRADARGKVYPIGLLEGGRQPIFEEAQPPRPPQAPCVSSRTRTPIKPTGWLD